jgi:hypothetical protein
MLYFLSHNLYLWYLWYKFKRIEGKKRERVCITLMIEECWVAVQGWRDGAGICCEGQQLLAPFLLQSREHISFNESCKNSWVSNFECSSCFCATNSPSRSTEKSIWIEFRSRNRFRGCMRILSLRSVREIFFRWMKFSVKISFDLKSIEESFELGKSTKTHSNLL